MLDAIDGILLAHLPSVARVEARPTRMIQQWLGSGTFVPSLDFSGKRLILDRLDWDGLTDAMASDIDRLGKAGRETLQVISCVDGLPKASAWILIQAYYASFYFAQVILRVCGIVTSYYTPSDLVSLGKIIDTYGVKAPFPLKGQLLLTLNGVDKTLTVERGDGGASHESTWHQLNDLMLRANQLVSSSVFDSVGKLQISEDIGRLRSAISGPSHAQSKLSSIRNNVQYRQELGGWYPYQHATKADELKRRINSSLSQRVRLSEFEIVHHVAAVRFLESCLCVCVIGRALLTRLEKIYGSGFLRNGYCKLENQYAKLNAASG